MCWPDGQSEYSDGMTIADVLMKKDSVVQWEICICLGEEKGHVLIHDTLFHPETTSFTGKMYTLYSLNISPHSMAPVCIDHR